MEYKVHCNTLEDTLKLAENLEAEKFPNMVIALRGELGSGKTTFTKAFARSMEIEENVTSPSFAIIKEYIGELPLFHMDVYRVQNQASELGIEEYFKRDGITIIEWAGEIEEYLPKNRLDITIDIIKENERMFIIKPIGKEYEGVCEAAL